MAMTPEGRVKKSVRFVLDNAQVYYFMPATGGYGKSGVPDIVGCIDGKFFAIECKARNNQPTELQEMQLSKICLAGGEAIVVNEYNIHLVPQMIQRLKAAE